MPLHPSETPITQMLQEWRQGKPDAQEALFSVVYRELQRIAENRLKDERSGHTLQPAGLVNEAWLRLAGSQGQEWENRSHFYGVAARLMRQVLIDHARARNAARRQSGLRVDLTGELDALPQNGSPDPILEVLELHEALQKLAALDERRAKVVELRYFGGLERQEIAEVLGVTERVVKRDLVFAQAWLRRELAGEGENGQHEP